MRIKRSFLREMLRNKCFYHNCNECSESCNIQFYNKVQKTIKKLKK